MNEPRDLTAALSSVEDDLAANWQRYRREAIGMDNAASGDLSEEQAAQIDQRLGQGFAFLRDVIDDPRLLTVVPDGSTLYFRDVEIPGHQIRLVACRIPDADNRWAARMTGSTKAGDVEPGHALMVPASVESDESAEAALDAFEELIRTIVAMTQEPAHRTP